MSIGLYLLYVGILIFTSAMSQLIPEIFILVGLITVSAGILVSAINESKMKERIDKLEDKIKALEERRKEDGEIH